MDGWNLNISKQANTCNEAIKLHTRFWFADGKRAVILNYIQKQSALGIFRPSFLPTSPSSSSYSYSRHILSADWPRICRRNRVQYSNKEKTSKFRSPPLRRCSLTPSSYSSPNNKEGKGEGMDSLPTTIPSLSERVLERSTHRPNDDDFSLDHSLANDHHPPRSFSGMAKVGSYLIESRHSGTKNPVFFVKMIGIFR